MNEILQQLHHYMGEAMAIDIQVVEAISMLKTDKCTAVISRLAYDFQSMSASPRHE